MEVLKSAFTGLCRSRVSSARKLLNLDTTSHRLTLSCTLARSRCSSGVQLQNVQSEESDVRNDPLVHADFFQVSKLFTIKDLFNAGIHFGHHEGCWNPFIKPYSFGSRERYHIFDLDKTAEHLKLALNVLSHVAYRQGTILFVSSHPQFELLVQETARESGEYFVTRQWNIGTFNNANILLDNSCLPDLVIFMNLTMFGRGCPPLKEAAQCNIPSMGIVDSDCDPRLITYPIPGNDDSSSAMELYCKLFKQAILNAKRYRQEEKI